MMGSSQSSSPPPVPSVVPRSLPGVRVNGRPISSSTMCQWYDTIVSMNILQQDLIPLIIEYGHVLEWLVVLTEPSHMFVWSPFDEPTYDAPKPVITSSSVVRNLIDDNASGDGNVGTSKSDTYTDEEIVGGHRWKRFHLPPNTLGNGHCLGNGCVINDTLFVRSTHGYGNPADLLQLPRLSYHIQNTPHNGIIGVGDWKLEASKQLDVHQYGTSTVVPYSPWNHQRLVASSTTVSSTPSSIASTSQVGSSPTTTTTGAIVRGPNGKWMLPNEAEEMKKTMAAKGHDMMATMSPTSDKQPLWLLIGGLDISSKHLTNVSSYNPVRNQWTINHAKATSSLLPGHAWTVVTYESTNQCYLFDDRGDGVKLICYNYVTDKWSSYTVSGALGSAKIGNTNACVVPNGLLCISSDFSRVTLLDPATMITTVMPSSWCWSVPKDDDIYNTLPQSEDTSIHSNSSRRDGPAGTIHRVQPYSIYDHSIIICMVWAAVDFEDVQRVIWMDYINEPGRWYNGPPLKRWPRLIVSAQQTI
jgi:hypothetical protein